MRRLVGSLEQPLLTLYIGAANTIKEADNIRQCTFVLYTKEEDGQIVFELKEGSESY